MRKILIILLLSGLTANNISAQEVEVMSSLYRSITLKHAIKIPEELSGSIPADSPDSVLLPLGTIFYKGYYRAGILKTVFSFQPAKGVTTNSTGAAYVYNFIKDSVLISIERNDTTHFLKYELPFLKKIQSDTMVNGYKSDLYFYQNPAGIPYRIWFSRSVPEGVSVKFYYRGMGGVTKVEYVYNGVAYVLDLVGFKKEKISSFKTTRLNHKPPRTKKALFPFFDVH